MQAPIETISTRSLSKMLNSPKIHKYRVKTLNDGSVNVSVKTFSFEKGYYWDSRGNWWHTNDAWKDLQSEASNG